MKKLSIRNYYTIGQKDFCKKTDESYANITFIAKINGNEKRVEDKNLITITYRKMHHGNQLIVFSHILVSEDVDVNKDIEIIPISLTFHYNNEEIYEHEDVKYEKTVIVDLSEEPDVWSLDENGIYQRRKRLFLR